MKKKPAAKKVMKMSATKAKAKVDVKKGMKDMKPMTPQEKFKAMIAAKKAGSAKKMKMSSSKNNTKRK
jgi:hypothetical protein